MSNLKLVKLLLALGASQVVLGVENTPPPSAGDVRDMGSIHGSGRSSGGRHATDSSILVWRIPWTEEPGGLCITYSWIRLALGLSN